MSRFLFLLALAACGGQVADLDAGADASAPGDGSTTDAVVQIDAAKPPKCTLAASDYGTACNDPSDCASVFLGNACAATCECPNGAIAQSGLSQYEKDLAAASDAGVPVCPCPPGLPPSCCKGQCVVGPCPP